MKTAQDVIDSLNLKAKPKFTNLFVLPLLKASPSFIVDAGENREEPEPGIVIASGPGLLTQETGRFVPVTTQPGELVWFGKWSGVSLRVLFGNRPAVVLIVPDSMGLAGQEAGDYDLVIHDDDPRKMHLAGWTCEYCPAVKEEGLKALREMAGMDPLSPFADLAATSTSPVGSVSER